MAHGELAAEAGREIARVALRHVGAMPKALARPQEYGLQLGTEQGGCPVDIDPAPFLVLRVAKLGGNGQDELLGPGHRQIVARDPAAGLVRRIAPGIAEFELEICYA